MWGCWSWRSRGCSGLQPQHPGALGHDRGPGSLRAGGIAPGASPLSTCAGTRRFSASIPLWMCCIPPGTTVGFWGKETVLQNYIYTMPALTGSWEKLPSIAAMKAVIR